MEPEQKHKIWVATAGLLGLLAIFAIYILCQPDDDRGTIQQTQFYNDEAGRNLESAQREADRIRSGITDSQERAGRVQEGIDRAAGAVERAEGSIRTATELARESRSLAEEGREILQRLPRTDE